MTATTEGGEAEGEAEGLVIAKPIRSKSADHIHKLTESHGEIEGVDGSKTFEEKIMILGEANDWTGIVSQLKVINYCIRINVCIFHELILFYQEETQRRKPEMVDAQWSTLATELQDIATSSYANRFNTWQKIFNTVGSYNIQVRKLIYQAFQEIS